MSEPVACAWATSAPEYIAYHDLEWGRPIRDDQGLYERLCLEAFQSGLSWITILRKREGFRAAFDGFALEKVAGYGPSDVERLLADPGIVRNRKKIEATIANARAALDLPSGLAELIWSYVDLSASAPKVMADVPAQTESSRSMAKELKKKGFRFVGPTTAYALMQACGLVNDHLETCPARPFAGPHLIVRA